MEKIFLTEEELTQLKELQTQEAEIITRLGELEYQLLVLNTQKDNYKELIFKNRQEGEKVAQSLQEKYGDGNINIETGEFTKA